MLDKSNIIAWNVLWAVQCCAPLLANLFLMSYDKNSWSHWKRTINSMQNNLILPFDILMTISVFNNKPFEKYLHKNYPHELSITKETHSDKEASYWGFSLHKLTSNSTQYYKTREILLASLSSTMDPYPHPITSNIPEKPSYGVYASHIISFARV